MDEGVLGGEIVAGDDRDEGMEGFPAGGVDAMDGDMEEVLLPNVPTHNGSEGAERIKEGLVTSCDGKDEVAAGNGGVVPILDDSCEVSHARREVPMVLDWRRAVIGDVSKENRLREDQEGGLQDVGVDAGVDLLNQGGPVCLEAGQKEGKSFPMANGKVAEEQNLGGKFCRELLFEDQADLFMEGDGITVRVDEEAASECEVELGRLWWGRYWAGQFPLAS